MYVCNFATVEARRVNQLQAMKRRKHFKASWKKQHFTIAVHGEKEEPNRIIVVSADLLTHQHWVGDTRILGFDEYHPHFVRSTIYIALEDSY